MAVGCGDGVQLSKRYVQPRDFCVCVARVENVQLPILVGIINSVGHFDLPSYETFFAWVDPRWPMSAAALPVWSD
jgi:hypothetical protein